MKTNAVNTQDLKEKLSYIRKHVKAGAKALLQDVMLRVGETASRYTPPKNGGSWSRTISATAYKRPLYNTKAVLQGLQKIENGVSKAFVNILRGQLEHGNNYFVIHKGMKKNKIVFGKNKRQMEANWRRIKYRGFMKVNWGLALLNKGKISKLFSRLVSKSPALRELSGYNKYSYSEENGKFSAENENRAIPKASLLNMSKNKTERLLLTETKKRVIELYNKATGNNKK